MSLRSSFVAAMVLACAVGCAHQTRTTSAGTSVISGAPILGGNAPTPFPVPGDTSRASAERATVLNLPKSGGTTVAPWPPPTAVPFAPPRDSDSESLPKFGDQIEVEVLPAAFESVAPSYPEEARKAGVEGTVMVQALVLRDGSVGATRVVSSVPGLDDAAMAAVRGWHFKPAMAKGRPVAVWVAVPVRFRLH
jgi:protein TonB